MLIKAYLDTCIISALVKSDLNQIEQQALERIHDRYLRDETLLFCSEMVDQELNRLPEEHKRAHLKILALFQTVPKVSVGGLTQLSMLGLPSRNPRHRLWNNLRKTLPDEEDAWHVFIAARNRIEYVITVDRRTMLSRYAEVKSVSGVKLILPSSFEDLLDHTAI